MNKPRLDISFKTEMNKPRLDISFKTEMNKPRLDISFKTEMNNWLIQYGICPVRRRVFMSPLRGDMFLFRSDHIPLFFN